MADISAHRRRRGVVKASITKLATRLAELEAKVDELSTSRHAHQLSAKLESLNAEFKVYHYNVVDAIPDNEQLDENMTKEQEELDKHDSVVAELSIRMEDLLANCSSNVESAAHKVATLTLSSLQHKLNALSSSLTKLTGAPEEAHLVEQYQEQITDLKKELADTRQSIITSCTLKESDALINSTIVDIDKLFFEVGLALKKATVKAPAVFDKSTSDPSPECMIKLPKLDIPTFDGNLLDWLTFWEQYCVAIHDRSDIPKAQKLVYLRQSLKDGSAKNAIEGLSRSGEQYDEAVECLQERYDRPRLIHHAHVRKIVETPSLKENTGKELRRLHDVVQQHLRALKAMGKEPSAFFVTSLIEMKLDSDTMFEWQRASQDSTDVPHYAKLLEFLNLRAQAAESSSQSEPRRNTKFDNPNNKKRPPFKASSYVANASGSTSNSNCVVCRTEKHPLYACTRFKSMSHDKMIATIKENNLCMNCLRPGHFSKQCTSLSKCRKCQKPHHTLIHIETKDSEKEESSNTSIVHSVVAPTSGAAVPSTLLMTCQVLVHSADGTSIKARALLDSASSTSFISERLTRALQLPKSSKNIKITGIAGISHHSPLHSVVNFNISPTLLPSEKMQVTAVTIPNVTSELPHKPVHLNDSWSHLSDLTFADPNFGRPGKIDILLGIDIYAKVLLNSRRNGPPESPVAFETKFGWVLAGRVNSSNLSHCNVTSHHVSVTSSDEILQRFWEIEEVPRNQVEPNLSPEEKMVVKHFQENHHRSADGTFVVPLPRKPQAKPIGESRTQAVRRFISLERSLHSKNQFKEFSDVIEEYFELQHAELVPVADLQKPSKDVFYLPMHAVRKEHSTTTKIRAVFDASAKSTTGVSLNDTLLVGPTTHPTLIDVLLRFRWHRVALTADVSKMYRAVKLVPSDRDLHRFVWRKNPNEPLKDYRMTRVTFGVSASSFAANMSVKQNSIDHAMEYPQAAEVVKKSFYVDDCLTGADPIPDAIKLQEQLQNLFNRGGFLLRKWNSNEPEVLQHLSANLKDPASLQLLSNSSDLEYTKTLGIEWNASSDYFRLTIAKLPQLDSITKRMLVSDIAKTFDVLGWFSPSTIMVKILLQQLWEQKIDWDDPVPSSTYDAWLQWRSELKLLSERRIPRCYFNKESQIASVQLHGFSDASENAYAAVVYLRLTDPHGETQISLVTSKTKVAPIRRLTIPRLELCGAYLLAQLLHHVRRILQIPLSDSFAWTDSTIVLHWLDGNPRRFKTYVGNRISTIMELIPPERWNHVSGLENPADCASRGLFPSQLMQHTLWWNGPEWLRQSPANWPRSSTLPSCHLPEEERETALLVVATQILPIIDFDRYSNFNRLKRVTAWILRFIENCRKDTQNRLTSPLSTQELLKAECYWIRMIQGSHFKEEVLVLSKQNPLDASSPLLSLHPFLDSNNILRVGGRQRLSKVSYESRHPVILHGKHPLARIIIRTEHIRLLHAGPTLLSASLSQRYHIVGGRNVLRSIVRECVVCRRSATKPQPQMLGQLPIERITPGPVFDKVGVDYAGPVLVKYGYVRKPTVVKAYICVFVSLTVKAVHLELVTDLTSDAFIASLRRFIARRGIPSLIWSDHGTNFVGASREINEFFNFLRKQSTQDYCCFSCQS